MDICLRYLMVISLPSLLILGCSPNLLTIRPLRKQSVCFSLNFFILLVITSTLTDSSTIYSSPDSLQNYISIKSYAYIYLLATFWVGVSKLICLNLNYYIVGGGGSLQMHSQCYQSQLIKCIFSFPLPQTWDFSYSQQSWLCKSFNFYFQNTNLVPS